MAHLIVIGNEKGGSGKTTTAMHLIVSLLKLGFKVGSMDLDARQQSLARYLENRRTTMQKRGSELLMPEHYNFSKSQATDSVVSDKADEENFMQGLTKLAENDFIVIDTPGSDAFQSRLAHSHADTVITPVNDSFIDLDLIGNISAETLDSIKPGIYSAMLWEQKMKRAARSQKELKWIVVRNRLANIDAINKRNVETSLTKLSKRFGFKIAPGFSDRVIFKELFLLGLTLHDAASAPEIKLNTSVIAARQELREFVKALDIPQIIQILTADHVA
jgi:chromosome partitioning protein